MEKRPKIKNQGSQVVEATNQTKGKAVKSKKKVGKDLRAGK